MFFFATSYELQNIKRSLSQGELYTVEGLRVRPGSPVVWGSQGSPNSETLGLAGLYYRNGASAFEFCEHLRLW